MTESVRSKLHSDFQCQCCQCGETMQGAMTAERVIIDRCGCIFLKSHLGNCLLSQLTDNIHNWFDQGKEICWFSCPLKDSIIGSQFSFDDIILDPTNRYFEVWTQAQACPEIDKFDALTKNDDFKRRHFALVPVKLAEVFVRIEKEQKEKKWEGMDWSTFQGLLNNWRRDYSKGKIGENRDNFFRYIQLERDQIQAWDREKNNCLKPRLPAVSQASWGIMRSLAFTIRAIYHGSMALIFECGLRFAKYQNILTSEQYGDYRERNVGDRLARLFLEYYGIEYSYSEMPPKSFEYTLWKSVLKKY